MKARTEQFFEGFSLRQRLAFYLVCASAVFVAEIVVVLR